MDEAEVAAYLSRIGAARSGSADADELRRLQVCHLRTVPFENLAIHLGERIVLAEKALHEKIVGARRGGFCYELNGLFAALLSALGFPVTLLGARVFGPDGLGPPLDHMALRVQTPQPWLVDVGFGRFSLHPLRLDLDAEQTDPAGVFQVVPAAHGDLDVLIDGEPQYRIEAHPRDLREFEPTCWWQQTSPASHFTASLVCSLPTDEGRVTLSGRRLTRTDRNGARREQELRYDEVLAAYRSHFGIQLSRIPTLATLPP